MISEFYVAMIIGALALGYFVGSIPTGYWFAKYLFDVDVTQQGSGNIGATNVARVLGGMHYFFIIFLLDAGKAILALAGARIMTLCLPAWGSEVVLCCVALTLLLGNGYSVFMNWRGGKGVATFIGCLLYLYPLQLLIFVVALWAAIFFATRRAYIASLVAALGAFLGYVVFFYSRGWVLGAFLGLALCWVVYRHVPNLKKVT